MQSQNNIYLSITVMLRISFYYPHDTKLFTKMKKDLWIVFIFLRSCFCKVNDWCLVVCFHREFRVTTQIMHKVFCLHQAFNELSGHFFCGSKYLSSFKSWQFQDLWFSVTISIKTDYSPRKIFKNKVVNSIWKTKLTNATQGLHMSLTIIFLKW